MSVDEVLVCGATGRVGREVVRGLLQAGRHVRAVTRDPARASLPAEVDVRVGDLGEARSIAAALAGADRLYLFPAGDLRAVCAAARDAGVGHVVLLSSSSVSNSHPDHSSIHHGAAEQAVLDAGLPHTFIRPGAFMSNDLVWTAEIAASGTVSTAYPGAATAPVDERDIAAVATAALLTPDAVGSVIELSGPESLSQRRRVELLAQVTKAQIALLDLTPQAARQHMERHLPAAAVDLILGVLAAAPDVAPTRPAPRHLLGREPSSYFDWATHHAHRFRRTPPQD